MNFSYRMLHFSKLYAIIFLSETEGSTVQIRRSSHCRIVGSLVRQWVITRFWTVKNVARELHSIAMELFAALFRNAERLFYCPRHYFKE